jgi:alpha-galactosidase
MKKLSLFILSLIILWGCETQTKRIYLHEMDLSNMETGWGSVQINQSVEGNPLSVGGQEYDNGVGTHAVSKMMIDLHGKGKNFYSLVGVDDESGEMASVEFFVLGDRQILWQSGIMKKGDDAIEVSLDISGIEKLGLYISDGGDNINYDHVDWINTCIEYSGDEPQAIREPKPEAYILTPAFGKEPSINAPAVFGARPGKVFLYRIPVSGERPMQISVSGLPAGLALDPEKGIIRGTGPRAGDYEIEINAKNAHGEDQGSMILKIGDPICLTPPLGWNSWNCWGLSVSQAKVMQAIDAMASGGLADFGWTYINIDDGWEAAERTPAGELLANDKFPDMKALADYAHSHGLKLGIYSSPGPMTCGGYLGSWEHEARDAKTWERWGIDYLKYDWCSYNRIAADHSLPELQKPYIKMRDILHGLDRDIVYSLCQYGMGEVWTWGESVGGNLWRTTGDITDSWNSMAGIGFSQDKCSPYAKPGHWNDPDMLVVGNVGWGPSLRETRLTPDEQYTHISLWALLASPLLIGCDMDQLDDFTLNLLTNKEVLAVNQDALGKQAVKVKEEEDCQVWVKDLMDGGKAVGMFYTGSNTPVDAFSWDGEILTREITVNFQDLGLGSTCNIRDLWRQTNLGAFENEFSARVSYHGVKLLKLSP